MNKLLLALLLAVSVTANARPIATTPTMTGGKIVLTNDACYAHNVTDGLPLTGVFHIYGVRADSSTFVGCWYFDSEYIHTMWQDGATRAYDWTGWTYIDEAEKPSKKSKK